MRMVVMLVVGIVIGAFGMVTVIGAMRTGTPLPLGIMAVSSHHFGTLREQSAGPRCDPVESARRLRTLRVMADDFDSAFLPRPGGDDAEFRRQTSAYQAALDAALAAAPQDCAALASAVGPVGDACKACHRDFRN